MSFAASGLKWGTPTLGEPSGTVYWSADIDTGINYNSALYSQSEFDQALADAFQAWEDVSGVDFEMASGSNSADISVSMGALSGSTVGLAQVTYNISTLEISEAEITLDSLEGWAPEGETDLSFYAVALHEIGHAIGLDHVADTTEIMNSFVAADDLGDGDIEGARYIYGNDGGSGPAPGGAVGPSSSSSDENDDDDGGGFFQWIFDLFASIFGGGDDDDSSSSAVTADTSMDTLEHEAGCGCDACTSADHNHADHDHDVQVEVVNGQTMATVTHTLELPEGMESSDPTNTGTSDDTHPDGCGCGSCQTALASSADDGTGSQVIDDLFASVTHTLDEEAEDPLLSDLIPCTGLIGEDDPYLEVEEDIEEEDEIFLV
ncbi:MAG: matrixin family metalloprotease [Pseudomonadota bacterium]